MVEQDSANRRTPSTRNRVLLGGKVVSENGDYSHDCVIRDLSDEGARIKVDSSLPPPKRLYLIDFKKGMAFHAQISWTKPPEYGLSFTGSFSLREETTDPIKKSLRRFWLERVAR